MNRIAPLRKILGRTSQRKFLNQRWRTKAACLGLPIEVFFPPGTQRYRFDLETQPNPYEKAEAVCEVCPVRQECFEDAIFVEGSYPFGFRGGSTHDERKRVYLQRRKDLVNDKNKSEDNK